MTRTSLILRSSIALAALLAMGPALAQSGYCRPDSDGRQRIARTEGRACPSGFFASGPCCEAFRREGPAAFPRVEGRPCPSGTYASGSACKAFR